MKNLKDIYLGDIIISFNYMNKPKNLNNNEFKKYYQNFYTRFFTFIIMIMSKIKTLK